MHVDTDAHQSTGHRAFVIVAASQVSRVGATGTHGHAKALRGAHHNVGIEFARRREQSQSKQIGRHNEGRLCHMRLCNDVFQIVGHARCRRVLRDHCKVVVLLHEFGCKTHQHLQAQGGCTRLNHFNGLRMAITGHNDVVAF